MGHQLRKDGATSEHASFCCPGLARLFFPEYERSRKISSGRQTARIQRVFNSLYGCATAMTGHYCAQTYGQRTIDKAIAGCREGYIGARPETIATENEPTSRPGSAPKTGPDP